VRQQWRRWLRGPKHGLARKAIVYGVPRHPGPEQLRALLGQYKSLQEWDRLQGFDLGPVPEGLAVLDEAIDRLIEEHAEWARLQEFNLDPVGKDPAVLDEAIDRFIEEHGRQTQMSAVESDAGRFLGTVIVSMIHGAHWRLWPNGHPVVRLASGRDLDVIALADDRLRSGQPRLAAVYADAATTDPDNQT
jgi:hypothetical protein